MLSNQTRPAYRLFSLNAAGRIDGVPDIIEAPDDVQAVREAGKIAQNRTIEVWTGARLVATLNGKGQLQLED